MFELYTVVHNKEWSTRTFRFGNQYIEAYCEKGGQCSVMIGSYAREEYGVELTGDYRAIDIDLGDRTQEEFMNDPFLDFTLALL